MRKQLHVFLLLGLCVLFAGLFTGCYGPVVDNEVRPLTYVCLSQPSLQLQIGETATLSAETVRGGRGAGRVSWATSDPSVAEVRRGRVTAVGIGSAAITATAKDGSVSACLVMVGLSAAEGLSFALQEDGSYAVTGCSETVSDLIIPALHEGRPVTAIAESAFAENTSLETVLIEEGVTRIGPRAFEQCSALTFAVLPDSMDTIGYFAFYDCDVLSFVQLGNGLQTLEDDVFYGCKALEYLSVPDSVSRVGRTVFGHSLHKTYNCGASYLGNADNPYLLLYNKANSKISSCTIAEGTKIICPEAFYDSNYFLRIPFEQVTIPDSVVLIGESAFESCELTEVIIPDSVAEIGASAFAQCNDLTSVHFGKGLKILGEAAFASCFNLTEMILPNSLTEIGDYAFYECSGLNRIVLPDSLTEIGDFAFYLCHDLSSAAFPDSLERIGECAFYRCGLTDLRLGKNTTVIGHASFASCFNLSEVILNDRLTEIGSYAFSQCFSLRTVYIPASVTKVGEKLFTGYGMLTVYCELDSPPEHWHEDWASGSKTDHKAFQGQYWLCYFRIVWGYRSEQNGT